MGDMKQRKKILKGSVRSQSLFFARGVAFRCPFFFSFLFFCWSNLQDIRDILAKLPEVEEVPKIMVHYLNMVRPKRELCVVYCVVPPSFHQPPRGRVTQTHTHHRGLLRNIDIMRANASTRM